MPGPVIKAPKIDAANVASKLPEPLRKIGGMALQGLLDMSGADDPLSGVYPTPVSPVAPLVSLFKDKAAREAGGTRFMESVKALPEALQRAWETVAENYPRITSHMVIRDPAKVRPTPRRDSYNAVVGLHGVSNGRPGAPVTYGPSGLRKSGLPALDTAYHEATHVAQVLGNRDSNALSAAAENLVGYHKNPFEEGARMAGGRRTGRMSPNEYDLQGTTAIQRLIEMSKDLGPNADTMAIKEILDRRGSLKGGR